MPLQQSKPAAPHSALARVLAAEPGRWLFPSPQYCWDHTCSTGSEANPAKCHRDDERTGASDMRGAEKAEVAAQTEIQEIQFK